MNKIRERLGIPWNNYAEYRADHIAYRESYADTQLQVLLYLNIFMCIYSVIGYCAIGKYTMLSMDNCRIQYAALLILTLLCIMGNFITYVYKGKEGKVSYGLAIEIFTLFCSLVYTLWGGTGNVLFNHRGT